jgi:four helix bundle protein
MADADNEPPYDLGERTTVFAENAVRFARRIVVDPVTRPLISQLVRCSTSVAANYAEADEADSRKEFRYRIGVAKREAGESKLQLRVIVAACPDMREAARPIWKEADELVRILAAIRRNTPSE